MIPPHHTDELDLIAALAWWREDHAGARAHVLRCVRALRASRARAHAEFAAVVRAAGRVFQQAAE